MKARDRALASPHTCGHVAGDCAACLIRDFAEALEAAPKVAKAPFRLAHEPRDVRGAQPGLFDA